MKKTGAYGIAVVAMVVFLAGVPSISSAQTIADLQAQITALLSQVQVLQAQLNQLQSGGTAWCHTFDANLGVGSSGSEVAALQTALQKFGFASNDANGTYGESTAAAVSGFQGAYKSEVLTPLGLQYGTGYTGPATRAQLNAFFACGKISTPATSTQTPSTNVEVGSDNTASSPTSSVSSATTGQTYQTSTPTLSNDNHYTNSNGVEVHSPAYTSNGEVPAGATAQCRDGTYSFSQHRRGTCSHHGGAARWL